MKIQYNVYMHLCKYNVYTRPFIIENFQKAKCATKSAVYNTKYTARSDLIDSYIIRTADEIIGDIHLTEFKEREEIR